MMRSASNDTAAEMPSLTHFADQGDFYRKSTD